MRKEKHRTDLGNAVTLVERHGDDMRHCAARRSWFVWDGKRWVPDAAGEAMRRAKDTVADMFRQAARRQRRLAGEIEDLQGRNRNEHKHRLQKMADEMAA